MVLKRGEFRASARVAPAAHASWLDLLGFKLLFLTPVKVSSGSQEQIPGFRLCGFGAAENVMLSIVEMPVLTIIIIVDMGNTLVQVGNTLST